MKYIENTQDFGLEYDFKLIKKEFKKLKIPKDVYNPCKIPIELYKYFIMLSDRSAGKTTNWILLGMVMNWIYGTEIQYIRQREDEIAPKASQDIFTTILSYDYISKLTDGQYNSVVYKSRRWYYSKVDDSGEIIERSNKHFMFMCSVDKANNLKSSYNAPLGDFIIFDEFIEKYYYEDEFIYFCDLVKTIIRERRSPIIIMLANVIDKNSQYFNELEIYEQVQKLHKGENADITTAQGTRIYVELLGATQAKQDKRDIVNKLFFGFKNPRLAGITGADWSVKNYQHIPRKDEVEVLMRNIYIFHNNKYIRLDIVQNERLGTCIYCHWATQVHDDSIILTIQDRNDPRYLYKLGYGKLKNLLAVLVNNNRIYFQTNDIGSFFYNYINYCKKIS